MTNQPFQNQVSPAGRPFLGDEYAAEKSRLSGIASSRQTGSFSQEDAGDGDPSCLLLQTQLDVEDIVYI